MSPIFVRPVREQLEHDRLIRFLLTKYKKKFDVVANLGEEQLAPLKIGQGTFFPDLVVTSGKKLAGVVEVESGESVNNLEAMAQWVHFSRARVPFHLYVPVTALDVAKRLCQANQVRVSEIWTYRPLIEGFDLVRGYHDPSAVAAPSPAPRTPAANGTAKPAKKAKPAPRPAPKPKPKPKPARRAAVTKAKPARAAKPKPSSRPSGKARKPARKAQKKR